MTCERKVEPVGDSAGGHAIRVEGVDSTGQPYKADALAIGTNDGPRLMNPVFWRSASLSSGDDTSAQLDVCP